MASAPKFDPPCAPRFAPRGTLADHFMTIAPDQRHASQDIARTVERLRGLDDDTPTKGFAPRAIFAGVILSTAIWGGLILSMGGAQ